MATCLSMGTFNCDVEEAIEEYQYYCYATKLDIKKDLKTLVSQTTSALKKVANSSFKNSAYIDAREIELVKDSLRSYMSSDKRVEEFKMNLISQLGEFQKQIRENHVEQVVELTKKQAFCERQIKILEIEKAKMVMDRLSKVEWPYDSKTEEYDKKIASLKLQSNIYKQKVENLNQMRPAAGEKELLLCEIQLKEKLSQLFE